MNYQDDYINGLTNSVCEILRGEIDNLDYITQDLIVFLVDNYDCMESLLDKVRVVLKPKEKEQEKLNEYLYYMHTLLSHNVVTNYFFVCHFPKLDKSRTPDKIYKLMKVLHYYNNSPQFNEFLGNLGIVTLIISYLYANDINDYKMLYDFVNNPEKYYEKLTLSGIKFDYDELNEFNRLPYEYMYQNIEKLLFGTKDKKLIK